METNRSSRFLPLAAGALLLKGSFPFSGRAVRFLRSLPFPPGLPEDAPRRTAALSLRPGPPNALPRGEGPGPGRGRERRRGLPALRRAAEGRGGARPASFPRPVNVRPFGRGTRWEGGTKVGAAPARSKGFAGVGERRPERPRVRAAFVSAGALRP